MTNQNHNISDINDTARDITSEAICIAEMSIDNFSSYVVNSEGHRVVRLKHYEVVPAKKILNYYQGRTEDTGRVTKAHIRLEYVTSDGEHIESKLYENAVAFFMNRVARQTDGATLGMKLSAVLKYISEHDIDVWLEFNRQYGVQVRYSEPNIEEKYGG